MSHTLVKVQICLVEYNDYSVEKPIIKIKHHAASRYWGMRNLDVATYNELWSTDNPQDPVLDILLRGCLKSDMI